MRADTGGGAGRHRLSGGAPSPWPKKKTKSPTTLEMQSKLPARPPYTMALAGVVIIFVNFLSTVC